MSPLLLKKDMISFSCFNKLCLGGAVALKVCAKSGKRLVPESALESTDKEEQMAVVEQLIRDGGRSIPHRFLLVSSFFTQLKPVLLRCYYALSHQTRLQSGCNIGLQWQWNKQDRGISDSFSSNFEHPWNILPSLNLSNSLYYIWNCQITTTGYLKHSYWSSPSNQPEFITSPSTVTAHTMGIWYVRLPWTVNGTMATLSLDGFWTKVLYLLVSFFCFCFFFVWLFVLLSTSSHHSHCV